MYTPDLVDFLSHRSVEWDNIMLHVTSQEEAVDFLDDLQFKAPTHLTSIS